MWWEPRELVDEEGGFSLVEMMVVVLVIAILMGIAVPTFLMARQQANDAVVEMNLRSALVAARVYFLEAQNYGVDIEELQKLEPSINWTELPLEGAVDPTTIYVEAHDEQAEGDTVVVGGKTNQGKCLYLKEHRGAKQAGIFLLETGTSSVCPALKPHELDSLDTVS